MAKMQVSVLLIALIINCCSAGPGTDRKSTEPNFSSPLRSSSSFTIPSAPFGESSPSAVARSSPDTSILVTDPMLTLGLTLGRCSISDCSTNQIFSPLSISTTLTMLLMGTNGNSYNELRSALGYHQKADDSGIVDSYKFVMERMKKLDSEAGAAINLDIANGLFMQRPSQLSKSYQSTATDSFKSDVQELNGDSFGSVNQVNSWVSRKTKNKINNILGSLAPDTQMIIANAVYLNANWEEPFPADLTRQGDFYISPSETIPVQMMVNHAQVGYVESSDLKLKMIAMPYKGEELGMYLIVPTEKGGLASLNRLSDTLTKQDLEQLFNRMEPKNVAIQLPKFRIQQKLFLKSALKRLGVKDLFSPATANLGRMSSKTGLALDDVIHQTFIEVTETGTEAAAATVVSLSRDGPSKSFQATQPFIFFIRDINTRSILFWGRLVRPESSGTRKF